MLCRWVSATLSRMALLVMETLHYQGSGAHLTMHPSGCGIGCSAPLAQPSWRAAWQSVPHLFHTAFLPPFIRSGSIQCRLIGTGLLMAGSLLSTPKPSWEWDVLILQDQVLFIPWEGLLHWLEATSLVLELGVLIQVPTLGCTAMDRTPPSTY